MFEVLLKMSMIYVILNFERPSATVYNYSPDVICHQLH